MLRGLAATLAVAAAGALAFRALGLPAPWLVGSVIATSAGAIAGKLKPLPDPLRDVVFVLLGVSMGSAVTPTMIASVGLWPGSMVALAFAVAAMIVASYLVLRRGFGWDRATSFYASPPGALTATLIMAATTDADMSKVAVVQVFRVFVLVAVAPIAIVASGASMGQAVSPPPASLAAIAVLIAAGAAGGVAARLVRLPGGLMVGAFAVSAALHATGAIVSGLPDAVTLPSFVMLGAIVGTRFSGLEPRVILSLLRASAASFLAATALAVGFAGLVGWSLELPIAQVFVAFAPGGLEAMMLTAYLLGLDPAYVGAHHVARFVALSFVVPIIARLVAPALARNAPPDGKP
jgi:membrane AbrB-like protein